MDQAAQLRPTFGAALDTRVAALDRLRKKDAISEAEYAVKRRDILDSW
jgi:hypothetical protein